MTTIITKTAKDGRIIEIKKVSYDHKSGGTVAAFVGSEQIAYGWPVAAVVKGRPEITHVFGGKIGLSADEVKSLYAAFASEEEREANAIQSRIDYEDNRRKIENA